MTTQVNTLYARLLPAVAAIPRLPDKPEESAEATLAALWHAAAGNPMSVTRACEMPLGALDADQERRLEQFVARRLSGLPLAHLTGRQDFMGLEFQADHRALIPRKETEILCRAAIELAREATAGDRQVLVIDVCTGSGNVALGIAQHVPQAKVWAADLSQDAVELARENAARFRLQDRVSFAAGDLFAPFIHSGLEGKVDIVTCNPPYIASQNVDKMDREISAHEPRLAFDGGPFGIGILNRVLSEALRFLKPGGWLCIEVGAGQGTGMQRMIHRNKSYQAVRTSTDHNNVIRSLQMQRALAG